MLKIEASNLTYIDPEFLKLPVRFHILILRVLLSHG